jgi:hypothetical protein
VSQGIAASDVPGESVQALAFRIRRDLIAKIRVPVPAPVQAIAPPLSRPVLPAVAPAAVLPVTGPAARNVSSHPVIKKYLLAAITLAAIAVGVVFDGNRRFNAPMYDDQGMLSAAESFARGQNYSNFDLNINIRKLRDLHIARMTETPDMILLGASHWQEAHGNLVTHLKWYNAHIHREFWQDLLGMSYILESHNRLPKKMVIALRDNIFAPIESRPDFLWEPGIPYWRLMADKLGIEKEPVWQSLPYHRFRERFSLSMLFNNVARWANADELPSSTAQTRAKSLDTLLPDGSINWSEDHLKVFTPERTLRESLTFADFKIKNPPQIEQQGVAAFEKLIQHLQSKGVTIYFARPPYNPQFWDKVRGTAYMKGLQPVLDVQNTLASKYNIKVIGSFDPYKVGCRPEQYIDSEHANPECLKNIFDEFTKLDKQASVK